MAKYIDAEKLAELVEKSKAENPHKGADIHLNHKREHEHFLFLIARFPAADVEPVVRCKECEHYDDRFCVVVRYAGDTSVIKTKPDDFCSYGNRKCQNYDDKMEDKK